MTFIYNDQSTTQTRVNRVSDLQKRNSDNKQKETNTAAIQPFTVKGIFADAKLRNAILKKKDGK